MEEAMRVIMDPLKRELEEGKKAKDELAKLNGAAKTKEKGVADLEKEKEAKKAETRRLIANGFLMLVGICILLFTWLLLVNEFFTAFVVYATVLMPMAYILSKAQVLLGLN